MSRMIHLSLLGKTAGSYKRQARHDCQCGPRYVADLDGSCQWCGRFPRALVAGWNGDRKAKAAARKAA